MKRAEIRWTGAGLTVICLAAGLVTAAPASEAVRAGDLAVALARASGVRLPLHGAERVAADFLAARGIVLGPSLDAGLLQRDLVEAARVVGAVVDSSRPSDPVTPAQGAAFVGAVRGVLRGEGKGTGLGGSKQGDINASCQGRAARAGRHGTPASNANPNATAPPCDEGEEPTP
jgi:hypothetical protein